MKIKILFLVFFLSMSSKSFATWTEFAEVGQLQSYGNGLQVWLKNVGCPNSKPYFSVTTGYTAKFDTIVSMILLAKASNTKVKFQYNTADHASFCYITGIQVQ
ncbi:hypothetical protein [Marinagarivorans algicola]|uniref:hypothetical protein n=1 Tax=Marinagarivorans algicola TaxID=1513270 RepID=UPI0012E30406|nr:hypothetical protein [Marinagarivorans algicola]